MSTRGGENSTVQWMHGACSLLYCCVGCQRCTGVANAKQNDGMLAEGGERRGGGRGGVLVCHWFGGNKLHVVPRRRHFVVLKGLEIRGCHYCTRMILIQNPHGPHPLKMRLTIIRTFMHVLLIALLNKHVCSSYKRMQLCP